MSDPMQMISLWGILFIILLFYSMNRTMAGVVIVYVLFMATHHLLPSILYSISNYQPLYEPKASQAGFQQSLYGLLGLCIGVIFIGPIVQKLIFSSRKLFSTSRLSVKYYNINLAAIYIIWGSASYFIAIPIASRIPSIGALFNQSSNLITIGNILLFYIAHSQKLYRLMFLSLFIQIAWVGTVLLGEGFLGFGLVDFILWGIIAFKTFPNYQRFILPGLLCGYFILSLFGTYMRERSEIRGAIWYTNTSTWDSLNVVKSSVQEFRWLNSSDHETLRGIDERLGQNYLLGRAIQNFEANRIEFANGRTITDALLMPIPRALWPDKPIRVGGNAIVERYTGLNFTDETTVSTGHVFDLYINYGTLSVVAGFTILGVLLFIVDNGAANSLSSGRWFEFALWMIAGMGFLSIDDTLVVLVSGSLSGIIITALTNRFILDFLLNAIGISLNSPNSLDGIYTAKRTLL